MAPNKCSAEVLTNIGKSLGEETVNEWTSWCVRCQELVAALKKEVNEKSDCYHAGENGKGHSMTEVE
jgi:hypothetical protein